MRVLHAFIEKDLQRKMVFIGGPRQCGKTTLAKAILENYSGRYLNYDRLEDRKIILNAGWSDDEELLVFDEIHKNKKWKNLVKGYYDTEKDRHKILVTGSARLNVYQKGGDSLFGRYHYWRLHPFSLYDIPDKISKKSALERLMTVGGFPEVFLDNNEREANRWRTNRHQQIIKEDIRDLEQLQSLDTLELLVDHLRHRVGSSLTHLSLAQEMNVSSITIKKWLNVLEKVYLIFTVQGYNKKLTRAVHKPIKVYFYDNADVIGDESVRFENLVANHLLQKNQFVEDYYGEKTGLFYAKDKNQREVDFVLTLNDKVTDLIEVKIKDKEISKNLISFAEILQPKRAIQINLYQNQIWKKNKMLLTNPEELFQKLDDR